MSRQALKHNLMPMIVPLFEIKIYQQLVIVFNVRNWFERYRGLCSNEESSVFGLVITGRISLNHLTYPLQLLNRIFSPLHPTGRLKGRLIVGRFFDGCISPSLRICSLA